MNAKNACLGDRGSIRFDFSSVEELAAGRGGKFDCSICFHTFTFEEIEISIGGFTVCPNCILLGPAAVATEAELCSRDIRRLTKSCAPTFHPEDAQGIRESYLEVAKALRGIDSWYELPGGAVAVAIADVHPEDTRRGYKGKSSRPAPSPRRREITHLMESMKNSGKGA